MSANSPEFAIDGVAYRCRRLSAACQFDIWRRVTPILPAMIGADVGLRLGGLTAKDILVLLDPLRVAPDEAIDAVFADARGSVERLDGEPVGDLPLSSLMMLTAEAMRHNFGALWALERPRYDPCPLGEHDKGFGDLGPVEMPNGVDWLYAPMLAGHCRYTELHDGSLQIEDIARMNDLLAVRSENEARLRRAAEMG